mgnify:CR=1 FL=1
MFLGLDIFSDSSAVELNKFSVVPSSFSLKNALFDEAFLSSDVTRFKSIDYEWDSDVLIFATFDSQNLEAGNIGTLGDKIQSMQLRRREVGKKDWTALTAYPIYDTDHLNFSFVDYFARGRNTKYEYSVNYILKDGTELPYISASVVSEFCGAVISDSEKSYHIFLDPSITSTTRNRQSNVITTLNSKYPYVFFGSNSNYDSATFSGTVIRNEEGDYWDFDGSYRYREELKDWLTNGEPKILKMEDGREWLMSVNGNIEEDCSEHIDKVKISFDFVQIGDYDNSDDLSSNGLIIYNDMDYSTYYSVSFNLVSTNSSSRIVSVKQGDSYTTKISAFEGYILNSVSISMNGIDITDSVYDEKTGTILIQNVTNDVVISAVSTKIKVDKIALNYSKLALSKNDKKKLVLVYSPSDAKIGDITWRSSDPENVIVSNGMVQGLKTGSAVITASLDGFEASCDISVISLSDSSGLPLSTFKEGAAIHIRENSASTYYIVSKHNYESELNGEGRTLLVRKAEYAQTNWGTSANTYNGSNVDQLLTGTFKDSLDSNIVKVLDAYPTKIYYTPGNGDTGITTISKPVFLLSSTEYGPNSDIHNVEGTILPVASQLLSAGCTGNKALLTRTPAINDKTNNTNSSVIDYFDSEKNSFESKAIKCTETTDPDTGAAIMIHPALTLPAEMKIIIDSPIKASSVTLNKTSLVIHVGEELKLEPKYLPLDATYPLINYGSANPFIATVSDGVLVGVSVGTTSILVSVDNISTTCEVRVVE